jgi:hypothetical protein
VEQSAAGGFAEGETAEGGKNSPKAKFFEGFRGSF